MFKNNEANFFKTEDNEQIFYLKNFSTFDSSKKTIVFNYGLVCSNHHWKYQVEYFDERGYQILMHDYHAISNPQEITILKKLLLRKCQKTSTISVIF